MCAKLAHYLSQQLFQETNHITFRNLKKKKQVLELVF